MGVRFDKLETEGRNPRTASLDALSVNGILAVMDGEEAAVHQAMIGARRSIARGVGLLEKALRGGGRIFFVGAGTSGRLGVLEAAECPPTFDTPPDLLQAIMAGGDASIRRSREGAEDDRADGAGHMKKRVRRGDAVVGITASGVTPFVHGALGEARRRGAATILVTCCRKGVPRKAADVTIAVETGAEVITGSTRLKAGTATKLVLNRLTVATMVRMGKVYGNLMVDLQPRSAKLRARAVRIIGEVTGADAETAEKAMRKGGNRAKTAIVMLKRGCSRKEAERLLADVGGRIGDVIS